MIVAAGMASFDEHGRGPRRALDGRALVEYKRRLGREVDLADIEEMSRARPTHGA